MDATFAWKAAQDPTQASLAVANMTGANRILIGIAWPLVVLLYFLRTRRTAVELQPSHGLELVVLLAATVYAFIIPVKGTLSWVDFVVSFSLFLVYLWRLAKLPSEEPHLIGPAQTIAALGTRGRRALSGGLALYAAALVLLIAEHFRRGARLHRPSVAHRRVLPRPVGRAARLRGAQSSSIVSIFAWRRAASAAMGALVSSKINQWTLLVAMLPLVYAISLGALDPMPLDTRQREEVLLTAAQSLFAVILLLDLRLAPGAGLIFGLFAVQFVFPDQRVAISVVYGVLSIATLVVTRGGVGRALAHFFSRPPAQK